MDINSIYFVEKQIAKIISSSGSDKEILVICNERRKPSEMNDMELKVFKVIIGIKF